MGNVFTSYRSLDGVNWAQVGTNQTITMAQNVYIGLAVSSDDNTSLSTAVFDNVSLNTLSDAAPTITSLSATTGPVGTQVVISGLGFGATQNGSAVLLSGAAVSINSWSSTSITITIPSGAISGPMLVSVAPSMNDSNYIDFTVTSEPLPTRMARSGYRRCRDSGERDLYERDFYSQRLRARTFLFCRPVPFCLSVIVG